MAKSEVRCETPRCVKEIEDHGERYHGVHEDVCGEIKCERCGGKQQPDGSWKHECAKCQKEVAPGKLVGLFVPHLCIECLDALRQDQIKKGHVCIMCRKPYADCCC